MTNEVECDIWVRGTERAITQVIPNLPEQPGDWTERDVRRLLSEMLLAVERQRNPSGVPPSVTLRGFSWIVNPYEKGGVLVHLEMQMGTASAGPIMVDGERLTALIQRVLQPSPASTSIH